jgi:hypothetical protein
MASEGVVLAADNDIVIKAVAYRLTLDFWPGHGITLTIGLLGTSRYVIPQRLKRAGLADCAAALAEFNSLLAVAHTFEPSETEVAMAADIEAAAQAAGLPLDNGESLLSVLVIERGVPVLETGDKRAISTLEQLRGVVGLERLDGRLRCLEQVIWRVVGSPQEVVRVATAICREREIDRALAICFQCHLPGEVAQTAVLDGLRSYIEDLRKHAPRLLAS